MWPLAKKTLSPQVWFQLLSQHNGEALTDELPRFSMVHTVNERRLEGVADDSNTVSDNQHIDLKGLLRQFTLFYEISINGEFNDTPSLYLYR